MYDPYLCSSLESGTSKNYTAFITRESKCVVAVECFEGLTSTLQK